MSSDAGIRNPLDLRLPCLMPVRAREKISAEMLAVPLGVSLGLLLFMFHTKEHLYFSIWGGYVFGASMMAPGVQQPPLLLDLLLLLLKLFRLGASGAAKTL